MPIPDSASTSLDPAMTTRAMLREMVDAWHEPATHYPHVVAKAEKLLATIEAGPATHGQAPQSPAVAPDAEAG